MPRYRSAVDEKAFQRAVVQYATVNGWRHYHTYDSRRSQPGFPDLVLLHPVQGRILYVELKTDKGRIKAAQKEWIACIRAAGGDARVWRPRDWKEIEQVLRRRRQQKKGTVDGQENSSEEKSDGSG